MHGRAWWGWTAACRGLVGLALLIATTGCEDEEPGDVVADVGNVRPDASPTVDAGDVDSGAAPQDAGGTPDPTTQITVIRTTPPGTHVPPLPLRGAWVTYVRPQIGNDPAGFFVQAAPTGPALFIAVDPETVDPSPAVGDAVGLAVAATARQDGQLRATAISGFTRLSGSNDVASWVQDLSAAADVVIDLEAYESELITVTGTITGAFERAGAEHRRIRLATEGLRDDPNLSFRVVSDVVDALGLLPGCTVAIGPTPMWRFGAIAQPSAWRIEDVSVVACAEATRVVTARAVDSTTVEVIFSRPLDPASVDAAAFAFVPDLAISSVLTAGNVVTLTTATMPSRTTYTVTADPVLTDDTGATIDANNNRATFTSPGGAPQPTAPGQLVITEIMQDPGARADADGEFVEVFNPSTSAVDLQGCVLSDGDAETHTIAVPTLVPAGGYATLARSATPGFVPTYVYTDFVLADTEDGVIVACGGTEIDRVDYDAATFPVGAGASMNLDPSATSADTNDLASNWCASTSVFDVDLGTPNGPNDVCAAGAVDAGVSNDAGFPADAGRPIDAGSGADAGLAEDVGFASDAGPQDADADAGGALDATADAGMVDAEVGQDAAGADAMVVADSGVDAGVAPVTPNAPGQIVVTEIMQNPTAVPDLMGGEWFELYNPSATVTYALAGCDLRDDGIDFHVISGSLLIPPGGYVTLSNGTNPGFAPTYTYTGMTLDNADDEVILKCGLVVISAVGYDDGVTFPDPTGASMNLDTAALDETANDLGANWCTSTTTYNGDRGTPGRPNAACAGADAGVGADI